MKINTEIINTQWVEKYRPVTLENYLASDDFKEKVQQMIDDNDIRHMLLAGRAGIGKTTLAKLLVKNLKCNYIIINASEETGVDVIRNKLKDFAMSVGDYGLKIIILDETEMLSMNAQAALKNLMETYSQKTRFILTTNHIEKIHEAIQSRCYKIQLEHPPKADVAKHLYKILKTENVIFSEKTIGDDLKEIINREYPDLRACVELLQDSVINNNLKVIKNTNVSLSYMDTILKIIKSKKNTNTKFKEIRQIIQDEGTNRFDDLYSYLYDNIDEYAGDNLGQIIIIIAQYQHMDSQVLDKEINAMALITEIIQLN